MPVQGTIKTIVPRSVLEMTWELLLLLHVWYGEWVTAISWRQVTFDEMVMISTLYYTNGDLGLVYGV